MQFHIIKILEGYRYTIIYINDLKYIHNNKIINRLNHLQFQMTSNVEFKKNKLRKISS